LLHTVDGVVLLKCFLNFLPVVSVLVGAAEFLVLEVDEGSEDHSFLLVTVVATRVCIYHKPYEVFSVGFGDEAILTAIVEDASQDLFELVGANAEAVLTFVCSGGSGGYGVSAELRHLHGCLAAGSSNFSL